MLLDSFWFRRCGAAGGADPGDSRVDGRTPDFPPWFGRGAVAYVHAPPRPFRGVAPVHDPSLQEGGAAVVCDDWSDRAREC